MWRSQTPWLRGSMLRILPLSTAPSIRQDRREAVYDAVWLPSYDEVKADKSTYAGELFYPVPEHRSVFWKTSAASRIRTISMWCRILRQSPFPRRKWTTCTPCPICGRYHPSYEDLGGVPAISEVKFSLISNRGCFGGCSFCALTFHQGRIVQVRSHESILEEAEASDEGAGFQGLYPRCGRPHGQFPVPGLRKAADKGSLPRKAVPVPEAL